MQTVAKMPGYPSFLRVKRTRPASNRRGRPASNRRGRRYVQISEEAKAPADAKALAGRPAFRQKAADAQTGEGGRPDARSGRRRRAAKSEESNPPA